MSSIFDVLDTCQWLVIRLGAMPSRPAKRAGHADGQAAKRRLRTALFRQLTTQKEEHRRRKSEAIRRKLFRLPVFREAKTVLCYVSLPYEVETRQVITRLLEAGKRVVVPKVRGRRLVLSELRDPDVDLAPGAFNVLEPIPRALRPVRPEELDVALVPGLAFDCRGHRLGHGYGYFDRLLARLPDRVTTIGLCFDFQRIDHLPTRPHDEPVAHVLSA